jgi:endonuclease III
MKKKERAEKIQAILDDLFPSPEIPLNYKNTFTFLIAVLLSAQCTDERVNKTTPKLFELADSSKKMAKLSKEDIQEIIRPCGLSNSKATHIKRLSEILNEKFNGIVPETFEELEMLPGVGHKTASVIMTQAFGKPAFPVDTHIHRLAKRWKLSEGKNVVQTEKDLKRWFLKENWNRLHLQMIYFGRKYCPARGHKIEECPICSWIN